MKWSVRPGPVEGEIKIVSKFAWFPTIINNSWVWLESFEEHFHFECFTDINGRHYQTNEMRPAWVSIKKTLAP